MMNYLHLGRPRPLHCAWHTTEEKINFALNTIFEEKKS